MVGIALGNDIARQDMAASEPPFAIGDRVRSRTYGLGKVVGPIVPISPDRASTVDGRNTLWSVPVQWDAPEWGIVDVADAALSPAD